VLIVQCGRGVKPEEFDTEKRHKNLVPNDAICKEMHS
jgi:hypothetical protein